MGYQTLVQRINGRRVIFDQCVDARYTMREKLELYGIKCIMLEELFPQDTDVFGGNHTPDEEIAKALEPNDVVLTRDVRFIEDILGKDRSIHVPQQTPMVSKRLGGKWIITTGVRLGLKKDITQQIQNGTLNRLYYYGMRWALGSVCDVCGVGLLGRNRTLNKHFWVEHGVGPAKRKSIEGFLYCTGEPRL